MYFVYDILRCCLLFVLIIYYGEVWSSCLCSINILFLHRIYDLLRCCLFIVCMLYYVVVCSSWLWFIMVLFVHRIYDLLQCCLLIMFMISYGVVCLSCLWCITVLSVLLNLLILTSPLCSCLYSLMPGSIKMAFIKMRLNIEIHTIYRNL